MIPRDVSACGRANLCVRPRFVRPRFVRPRRLAFFRVVEAAPYKHLAISPRRDEFGLRCEAERPHRARMPRERMEETPRAQLEHIDPVVRTSRDEHLAALWLDGERIDCNLRNVAARLFPRRALCEA